MNLRYTNFVPPPSPGFGAALEQAGTWNSVNTPQPFGPGVSTPLVDLDGASTLAVAVLQGCDAYTCDVTGYGSDVASLFAAGPNGDCYADPSFTMLQGLAPGKYVMTAYTGSCYTQWSGLTVTLNDQSYQSTQQLGGEYLGNFDSMDLGSYAFDLADGVKVKVNGWSLLYVTALQLTRIEPPQVFCTAKVNSQGCAAEIAAIGNAASLSGAAPFHLVASDVVNDVPGILFYGFDEDIKPFMGGLHCVQPPTPRTTYQFSGGGGVPCGGTFDLDFNAWLATQPQPKVHAGMRLYAQYWYRDPADPFASATSDAVSFHIVP
ncbi:MAG TPA: hypothetical protein VMT18_14370 [Planctomycetota bacterium]|nr:hypothetical protein [Planctomycetota bacterium]